MCNKNKLPKPMKYKKGTSEEESTKNAIRYYTEVTINSNESAYLQAEIKNRFLHTCDYLKKQSEL